MKFLLSFALLLSFNVFSAEEKQKEERQERKFQTTTERAEDMFRKPGHEDKGKIPEKLWPIDHKVKTTPDKDSE